MKVMVSLKIDNHNDPDEADDNDGDDYRDYNDEDGDDTAADDR